MPISPARPSRRCSQATAWPWPDLTIPLAGRQKTTGRVFCCGKSLRRHGRCLHDSLSSWEEGDGHMTPEERNLVVELFDRLAALEDAQRDPDAERLIRDGLRQAPNAPDALVQTGRGRDDALMRADGRIRGREGAGERPRDTSFLGNARDSLQGRRRSVPSVRPGEAAQGPS